MRIAGIYIPCAILFLVWWMGMESCHPHPSSKSMIASSDSAAVYFPFILSEKTMIINREQDNEREGHYLKVVQSRNDSIVQINLPGNFYLYRRSYKNWMLGWPGGKAYYDAGNENLREIISIDSSSGRVTLGKLLRGNGYPSIGNRVVFWNRNPSGFMKNDTEKIIHPEWWKGFAGRSIEFGKIIFDAKRSLWVMYVQEVDTPNTEIYAAVSADLIHWSAYNKGKPIFVPQDFEYTTWACNAPGDTIPQTARLYDVVAKDGLYYFFFSGVDKENVRSIGMATSNDLLDGPFKITDRAVVAPGFEAYDKNGCFYPKLCFAENKYLMYYDGVDKDGVERVCLAESENLKHWQKYSGNPVLDRHYGWRSGPYTTEPNLAIWRNDTVWLMAGGYKKYNTEFTAADSVQNRLPLDKTIFSANEADKGTSISGNVMDAELGVFISTDGGHTFRPHSNNPIWVNDYSDTLQDDHLGGDFFYTHFQGKEWIIYQAKSATQKRYNILWRERVTP